MRSLSYAPLVNPAVPAFQSQASIPPILPVPLSRLWQIPHSRSRTITARANRILRHESARLHAPSHIIEIPDLVQRAAGAADDGRDTARFLQGRKDGGRGVGLCARGQDGGCGEELRGGG